MPAGDWSGALREEGSGSLSDMYVLSLTWRKTLLERAGQTPEDVIAVLAVLLLKLGEGFARVARVVAHVRVVEADTPLREVLPGKHVAAFIEALGEICLLCHGMFFVRLLPGVFFGAIRRKAAESGAFGKFFRQRLVHTFIAQAAYAGRNSRMRVQRTVRQGERD